MTEKRFVQNTNLVMQNNEVYVVCADEHSADVVTTALNEVLEENEQLKESVWSWSKSYHRVYEEKEMTLGRLNDIKSTLAYRSNQLALMEQLIDDLGSEEMKRQMEEILNG